MINVSCFIYCKYDIKDHDTNNFWLVCVLLFACDEVVVRHEILHSSMRHKLRHKVFERRQTPSWYDFFTSQSKHVTFSLILAHSSTNILWNFETPFDSCFVSRLSSLKCCIPSIPINQHQREAPSPHLPALIAALAMSYGDAAARMPRKGFKLVLLGDASVGKSSILLRFLHNKFSEEIAACHEKPNMKLVIFFLNAPYPNILHFNGFQYVHVFFTYHKDHLSCKFSVFSLPFCVRFSGNHGGCCFQHQNHWVQGPPGGPWGWCRCELIELV